MSVSVFINVGVCHSISYMPTHKQSLTRFIAFSHRRSLPSNEPFNVISTARSLSTRSSRRVMAWDKRGS